MNEIQKHLMILMDEIMNACKEVDASWILYGQTAGCAAKYGKFTTGAYPFHIILQEDRFPAVKKSLLKANIANRAFESKDNNPKMDTSIVRYVDTATCLFDRKEAAPYRINGAAVTIHLLISEKSGISRLFKKKEPDQFQLHLDPDTVIQFPARFLFQTKLIPFEGRQLAVPIEEERYYQCLFGEKWEKNYAEHQQSVNSSFVIWDAECSYMEYLKAFQENSVDIYETFSRIKDLDRFLTGEYQDKKKASDYYWEAACRSVDRIVLFREYQGKRADLQKASAENDLTRLKELLQPYLERTNHYLQSGLGFYIDRELFEYAGKIWYADGTPEYAERIMELVPKEYLNDDLQTFLGEYTVPEL